MSRESSPEEGEILEDGGLSPEEEPGELVDEPVSVVDKPTGRKASGKDSSRLSSFDSVRPKYTRVSSSSSHKTQEQGKQNSAFRSPRSAGTSDLVKLQGLTKPLNLTEANRNTKKFCQDLEEAFRIFVRWREAVPKSHGSHRSSSKEIAEVQSRLFLGLRALHILSNTGAGRTGLSGCRPAEDVVQSVEKHLQLFSAAQQREFRSWIGSKVFGALLRGTSAQLQQNRPQQQIAAHRQHGRRPEPPKNYNGVALPKPPTLPPPKIQPLPLPRPPIRGPGAAPPPAANRLPKQTARRGHLKPPPLQPLPPVVLDPKRAAQLPQLAEAGKHPAPVDVPGLEADLARSSPEPARPQGKRAKPSPAEDEVSLDDELDLYMDHGPPSVLLDTPQGSELELSEVEGQQFGALPPGIDLEASAAPANGATSGRQPRSREDSDAELLEEEARIFGLGGALEKKRAEVRRQLGEEKLCLVLDLDHTLLNSAKWGEVAPQDAAKLEALLEREAGLPFEQRGLHSLEAIQMWTKLRPACRQLLQSLAEKFVMWIHTNGNKHYAEAICKLLDPGRQLFGDRVVASSGASGSDTSAAADLIKRLDAQGLAGLEPITVIVDDTASVWPGHAANLLQVERYCYFPSSTKQFGYSRGSLLEAGRDESPDQGMLSVVQRVLEQAHAQVLRKFAEEAEPEEGQEPGWDVRAVISGIRGKILRGVTILFSRLWPTDQRSEEAPLWLLAERLGASCTTAMDDSVTHVVTNTRYTEKVAKALQQGKHVVSARWLEGSSIMWARADERSFQVPP